MLTQQRIVTGMAVMAIWATAHAGATSVVHANDCIGDCNPSGGRAVYQSVSTTASNTGVWGPYLRTL